MRSFPINRMRYLPSASRRNLYRRCKRILYRLARSRWRGQAKALKRLISDFLRRRSLPFLLRVIRQHGFAMLLASALLAGTATRAFAIEASDIAAGRGGFVINGAGGVSDAGDVNGDGLDDVIIGTASSHYVVFGKEDTMAVELSDVTSGTGGFVIEIGGYSVSGAGDVNGDGLDDVIIGAPYAGTGGQAYVVFGKDDGTPVDLEVLGDGTGGFVIHGIERDRYGEVFGASVSGGGDINGDGFDDVIVAAPYYAWYAVAGAYSKAYVVFGKDQGTPVNATDVDAGSGGFVIREADQAYLCGSWEVSHAGDVNSDGLDDVILGQVCSDVIGYGHSSHIVFGKADGTPVDTRDVAAGAGGFVIRGTGEFPAVSGAGDVNGDGFDDVIIGDWAPYGDSYSGTAYVVFGKGDTLPVNLSHVATGTGGFVAMGTGEDDYLGIDVSGAGDVNGDGLDDVIVGTRTLDENYVIFGKDDTAAVNIPDVIAGIGGFVITATDSGRSVSGAGDVNGDGLADVIISAPGANRSYVIFGFSEGGGDRKTVPISCPSVTAARDTSLIKAMQPLRIVRDTLLQDSTAGKRATQIYYSRGRIP